MWLCSAHTKLSRDDALNVSPFPGQHHYPSSPSNWQRGFGWPLASKNQNHCSLRVCTCYYLCLQKWKSLDLMYLPCTCHSRLVHSHQGTAVYIIRWKKIYKVWSDLWDPILRFKVWFGPDRVRSRSGPRWTPNRTPSKNYDPSGPDLGTGSDRFRSGPHLELDRGIAKSQGKEKPSQGRHITKERRFWTICWTWRR